MTQQPPSLPKNSAKNNSSSVPKKIPESQKKMTGPFFWIVLGIVIVDDIVDVIVSTTGVGAPISSFISPIIAGISLVYTWLAGASINTRYTLRFLITQAAELVVFLNMLPFGAIFLILTRLYENDPKIKAAIDMASKATPKGNITRQSKSVPIKRSDNPNITRVKRG